MMEHFLTLNVFNQGVRNYIKERAYKNANADQLWHELTYVGISFHHKTMYTSQYLISEQTLLFKRKATLTPKINLKQ